MIKHYKILNPFMHNVVKWPNILWRSCGVDTSRFLKYVWPFYNIVHQRVKHFYHARAFCNVHGAWGSGLTYSQLWCFWERFYECVSSQKKWSLTISTSVAGITKSNFANLRLNSCLPKRCFICFNDSPLKIMKNAFYLNLKVVFILKISKFLIGIFGRVVETAWLERYC